MEVFNILKKRNYGILALASSLSIFIFLPYIQSLGNNVDLWYSIILGENYGINFALFLIFTATFGLFTSFQVYKLKQPKVCKIKKTAERGFFGSVGSVFAFFVGVCPACIGFAGLFLPVGIVTTLVVFGPFFMLISIGLLLLSIYLNNGFK